MQVDPEVSVMRQELIQTLLVDLEPDTHINERVRKVRRLRGPSPPPPPPAPDQQPRAQIKRKRSLSPAAREAPPKYPAHIDSRAYATLDKVHSTHQMRTHRGLAWCNRCGCLISFLARRVPALKDLSKPCQHPTFNGTRTLSQQPLVTRHISVNPRAAHDGDTGAYAFNCM